MAIKTKRRRTATGGGEPAHKPKQWGLALLMIVGALLGLLAIGVTARWLATTSAPWLYLAADGDHARLVAILVALWALFPLGCGGAFWLGRRRRQVWGWVAAVPLVPVGLFLLGTSPGRGNDGRLSRTLNNAVGGGFAETGEVFTSMALAGLVGNLTLLLVGGWILVPGRTWPRLALVGVLAVGGWAGIGALVVSIVGDTESRGGWLDRTAAMVAGGDDGLTGQFQVGLDASVLDVVDCDTAAAALRVEGEVPALDGCREALLVSATGRYDQAGRRLASGELVAVVLQVRTEGQLEELDAALDGVELVEASGLPRPPGQTLATKASKALSLVVAAEDTGEIPLPAEGAGLRPLTRALAYVVLGTAQSFYIAPPDETPAP